IRRTLQVRLESHGNIVAQLTTSTANPHSRKLSDNSDDFRCMPAIRDPSPEAHLWIRGFFRVPILSCLSTMSCGTTFAANSAGGLILETDFDQRRMSGLPN